MKSDLLKQIRGLFKKKQVKLNKRILYFLFFLFISALIWFFNKLDNNYITQIKIPVHYYNFPKNVIQTANLPHNLTVSIYGRGFLLLRYKLLSFTTFYINLSQYLNTPYKGNKMVYLFYTENLIAQLDKELSDEVKILTIEPRTIKFEFAKKSTKKLPIIPQLLYSIEKHHVLKNITLSPEFALIAGPSNILDTITTLHTKKFSISNLNHSLQMKLPILPIKHCEIKPAEVKININVDKKTEKTITFDVHSIINANTIPYIRLIPEKINLICNVAVSDYELVNNNSFKIECSCTPATNQEILYCIPTVVKKPSSVSYIRFEPSYITIIVNK